MDSAIATLVARRKDLESGLYCISRQIADIENTQERLREQTERLAHDEAALADINDALAVLERNNA